MNEQFETIVPAAQAGDKAAQDALMVGFYPWSIRQARLLGAGEEEGANIAVEFWAELFATKLQRYDPARGKFFTWLRTVLRNYVRDALRKKQPELENVADMAIFEGSILTGDNVDDMLKAIEETLTAGELAVFFAMVDGESVEDTALRLDISEGHVRDVQTSVRRKAKEALS